MPPSFVPLSPDTHGDLTLASEAGIQFAADQHMLFLRAAEVARAAATFPIFMNRAEEVGTFVLSAIAGLEPGQNLFVENGEWRATYLPSIVQTYPFTLVPSERDPSIPAIAVDETSPALGAPDGDRLYDDGKESLVLSRLRATLEADIENDRQTAAFCQWLEKANLVKPVDLIVRLADGSTRTITGLHTVDEDGLRALPDAEVVELHKSGYLMLTHAMLLSIGQVNRMILQHNNRFPDAPIEQVRLEVGRDRSQPENVF